MSKSSSGVLKKILLFLTIMILVVIVGAAATAYWAYQQQTAVLVSATNRLLMPYGIEVLRIDGLQTGLQHSRADAIEFRIRGQAAEQRIEGLTLDYELATLIQGQFSQLTARSASLQLQHAQLPDGAAVDISDFRLSCQALAVCSGSAALNTSITLVHSSSPALLASDIRSDSRISFDYSDPVLELRVEPGVTASLTQASTGQQDALLPAVLPATRPPVPAPLIVIEQLALSTNQTWRLNVNLTEQLLVFDGGQLQLKAPVLRNQPDTENAGLSGFEMNITRFNGSYDYSDAGSTTPWMSRLNTQWALEIGNVYTTLQPFNLWSYRWPLTVRWDPAQHLTVDINAETQGKNVARLQLQQNFATGRGTLAFNTDTLEFSPTQGSLGNLISPLPLDADLLSGSLEIAANIHWQQPGDDVPADTGISAWQPGGTITTNASGLAGVVDETIFSGLSTSAQWQLQNDLGVVNTAPARLRIQKIDPGLPLNNIETHFHLNTGSGVLALSALNFDMFGGVIESDPFAIHLKQSADTPAFGDSFELRMTDVDISQVLALSAYNGVSATGLVSGTLPIRLHGLKPVIEGGHLQAGVPGGSIRYDSGSDASGNQSLDLVYQALEHYRYDTLTANVDYDEQGELTLAMQLQGISPELNNGQRINLNLNISDNIPTLLQSLQAAQGITDRLEELLE